MSTAIIVIILIVICVYSVKSYSKKLTHGCCGGESDGPIQRVKPQDPHKENYLYCQSMKIEGMTCQNCQRRIENLFNQLDGYYMEVNLKKHSAKLYTKQDVSQSEIKQKIASLGYRVTKIENADLNN